MSLRFLLAFKIFSIFGSGKRKNAATALKRQGYSVDYREALPHRMDMVMMRAVIVIR
jgi:hypothetical protein